MSSAPQPRSAAGIAVWRRLVRVALAGPATTPFYLCRAQPVRAALDRLAGLERALPVPVVHWLSCKTQPLAPLLDWWRRQDRPIEVVSEFEFRAAREVGFPVERILINGPAKQRWLPGVAAPGMRVNFDSPGELRALLPLAQRCRWRCGVRILTSEEFDPGEPRQPTQFGLTPDEAVTALRRLRRAGVATETVHFHLRTNVAAPTAYARAMAEVATVCRAAEFQPLHLDVGGGLPPPNTRDLAGRLFAAGMDLDRLTEVLRREVAQFPGLRELWLENGRFLLTDAGVLVITVLEVKERRGRRQLICDGGRTLHALVSNWEQHELLPLTRRSGRYVPSAVYGPTCMAFDQLACRPLPGSLRVGDQLLWFDAGAYHLSWETRFSHGLAAVLWEEEGRLTVARPAETFTSWWRGR